MAGLRRVGWAVLTLASACSTGASPATVVNTSTTPVTAAATTTSTTEAAAPVVPAVGRVPHGVDARSACMQRAAFGDPAESPYLLPYPVGERYLVNQSYCYAGGGHRGQLAYDFVMPIGAEVLAARAGTVVDLRDDSPDDGQGDGEHNYLMIRHDDGTVAFYAHLRQHGLAVGDGDRVEAGDLIAYAGNSGLTGGPHLHFGVYQTWPPREGRDVPVVFRNAAGELDLLGGLASGVIYEALPMDEAPPQQARPPSDYHGASLAGLVLPRANLWGYDFSGADLTGADLSEDTLAWATLAGAILTGADLTYADLTEANLQGANLRGAVLVGTDLSRTDLRRANLQDADLSGAYAALADLRGADLTGASLDRAVFIAPQWDDRTVWPEGYQPPPRL